MLEDKCILLAFVWRHFSVARFFFLVRHFWFLFKVNKKKLKEKQFTNNSFENEDGAVY